eukprot:946212-Rhodomonas_salina.2
MSCALLSSCRMHLVLSHARTRVGAGGGKSAHIAGKLLPGGALPHLNTACHHTEEEEDGRWERR